MAAVLLVEDDETIGSLLESALRMHDYDVMWSRTGGDALRRMQIDEYDIVLLDLGLPDLDGIEVCRRARGITPDALIIMITARTQEMDVVVGLEVGADDYLTKPLRLRELLARLHAHLRRGTSSVVPLRVGEMVVQVAARRVTLSGDEIALRPKEFDLLHRLAQEPGAAISRDTLMADVWDTHWRGSTKTLDVHIVTLRRKLAGAATSSAPAPTITTVRGYGYRLELPAP
ncbi:DNA-binding response regulator [Amycolatopsis sp. NBRC 101858]|uniref:response regulator transcription factor n=1 Tax=Amycolatopsis sp. NBRC 101858 TaxID=3032200 RepID=UPI0024A51E48|nr:response regulator transcription factor [Amycolatopsis sp. NBRC 101858]GLY40386.1 DNA-binding response regulator [Amycolatopsis sp. NBRC 101858]